MDADDPKLQSAEIAEWINTLTFQAEHQEGTSAFMTYTSTGGYVWIFKHKNYYPDDLSQAQAVLEKFMAWSPAKDSVMNARPD